MCRRYGRARRGERLVQAVPQGHWHISTFIGALRHDGLVAPCVVDGAIVGDEEFAVDCAVDDAGCHQPVVPQGAIDGELFVAYVEQQLAPTLRPGDVVVMDNLSSHKVQGVRTAIENKGAELLYLPPDSPDLNPIEMAFAKLKSLLRAKTLRTMDELWNALGPISDAFSQAECSNYFRHAGYRQSA